MKKSKEKFGQTIIHSSTTKTSHLIYAREDSADNPRKLKIEQLRKYKGLENLNDEQASEIIEGLYKLSLITYKIFQNKNEK